MLKKGGSIKHVMFKSELVTVPYPSLAGMVKCVGQPLAFK